MFNMDDTRGDNPHGAGVFVGDGIKQHSETKLALAEHQGKNMASTAKKLAQHA
jgi:NAD(P)H dehydrogenase (quinone)